MRIMLPCLIIGVTLFGVPARAIPAREIKTGYLVVYGQPVKRPFSIETNGSTMSINGIQILPPVWDPREAEATRTLDAIREDYHRDKDTLGNDNARQRLDTTLRGSAAVRDFTINEQAGGRKVTIRHRNGREVSAFLDVPPPSWFQRINRAHEQIVAKYRKWRKEFGKEKALYLIDEVLKKEPLIERYVLRRDVEAYTVVWKGQTLSEGRGLWPEQYAASSDLPAPDVASRKRVRSTAEGIVKSLRDGDCIVVDFGGIWIRSPNGESCFQRILQVRSRQLSKEDALRILSKDFDVQQAEWLWKRLSE